MHYILRVDNDSKISFLKTKKIMLISYELSKWK